MSVYELKFDQVRYQLINSMMNRQNIADLQISGCIVALGSNYEADRHLTVAREQLERLTQSYQWSAAFNNPDYTATVNTPKPHYTNQCGYLNLKNTCTLYSLSKTCKQIEQHCKRATLDKDNNGSRTAQVSMDIDILAVLIEQEWIVIKQRYPFKAHEIVGIKELVGV